MPQATSFYNRYHQKNNRFAGVIKKNNFTYWYIQQLLHQAFPEGYSNVNALDVGCGVGAISLYLASQGAIVKGIDVSTRAIEIATEAQQAIGYSNVLFEMGELKKGPAQYDLVTCFEVIEHIPEEAPFLANIHSQLKPGAILALSTPSLENMLYRSGFYRQFDEEVGHLRRYTTESITQLLQANGFEVISVRQVEGPLRNLLFTTKLGALIRFIRGPLIPLFHLCDRLSGVLFGYSDIQVLAKKI